MYVIMSSPFFPRGKTEKRGPDTRHGLPDWTFTLFLLFHLGGTTTRRCRGGGSGSGLYVEHIVASDENLTEEAGKFAIDKLLGLVETEVHVRVGGGQYALIFLSPL